MQESFRENSICEFFDRFNPTLRLEKRKADDPPEIEPVSDLRETSKISTRHPLHMLNDALNLCIWISLCLKSGSKETINDGLNDWLSMTYHFVESFELDSFEK